MGQYRLWFHHRQVDQNLREQQKVYEHELLEIDEHIARIENAAMQKNNALLTALMQQITIQKQVISENADVTVPQPAHNGTTHENVRRQKYQAPPPSQYGQQNTSVSPALLAWSQLPNFDTHEIHLSEEHILSEDDIPILPDATDHLLPSDLNALFDDEPSKDASRSLPWWLRNIMRTPHEDKEPQKTAPIDQQSMHINQRVERWFVRRNKLAHRNVWQEGQEK